MTERYLELADQEEFKSRKYLRRDRKRNKTIASKSHRVKKYITQEPDESLIYEYIIVGYNKKDMFEMVIDVNDLGDIENRYEEIKNKCIEEYGDSVRILEIRDK